MNHNWCARSASWFGRQNTCAAPYDDLFMFLGKEHNEEEKHG